MALYHQVPSSSAFVALQGIHELNLLVYDPPRFNILLLLVSVLTVILVKSGFFTADGHRVGMFEERAEEEVQNLGIADVGDGACAMAVLSESDAEENVGRGLERVEEELPMEQKSDHSDTEASPYALLTSTEPAILKQKDKEEMAIEGGEEDVEDLHKRVEAYICKVRRRFNTETVANAIDC